MKKLIHLAVISALSVPFATLAAQETKTERQGAQTQPADTRAGQAQSPSAQPGPTAQQGTHALKGSTLKGMDIKNKEGKDLGDVQDLVIDLNNNRVHYAIVDAQNKMFAYPMRVFQVVPGQKHLQLNVPEERLEKAPGMDRSEWDKGGRWNRDYERKVEAYWQDDRQRTGETAGVGDRSAAPGAPGDRPRAGETAGAGDKGAPPSAQGPTVKVEPRENMQLVRASNLIGKNIEGGQGKGVGEVKDLIINPSNGQVYFALVDFNDDIVKGDLHPVALSAFSLRGDDRDKLVLNVDKAQLKPDRSFDKNQLDSKLNDPNFLQQTSQYAASVGGQTGAAGRAGGEQKSMPQATPQKSDPQQQKGTSGQPEKGKSY
jgi:sporulation protein YlmC with PRC-barrel domain